MSRWLRLLPLLVVLLAGCGSSASHKQHVITLSISSRCPNGPLYRPCGPHLKGWATQPPQTPLPRHALAPVPTREMFDTVTVSTVPSNPWAVAGYTSGFWPTDGPLRAAFPNAHHLSIAINAWHDADCADDEPLDLTNSQTVGWIKRQLFVLHHTLVCAYTSISNMGLLKALVAQAGVALNRIKWWCAWYRFFPGLVDGCDAVQWTDTALGRNLDESTVRTDFFGPPVQVGPDAATLRLWGQTKNGAFRHYHNIGCRAPQDRNPYCASDARTVRAYQDKLWAAHAPNRWACFGPRTRHQSSALLKSEVCWIVRPQVAWYSGARDASKRALVRCLSNGPVTFPTPCRQRGTFAQRVRYFDQQATTIVKAYS